jgi:DNA-3-methyladenine glycosylase II
MSSAINFDYLRSHKKLYAFIQTQGSLTIEKRQNVFLQLVRAVAGQQLSVKAAASIFARFVMLCNTKTPKPDTILSLTIEQMREVGFSYSKAQYIHNIAAFWQAQKLTDKQLHSMSNDDVIALLTQIKGVGRWTVEMLLMFTLGREDVFTTADLGIQQGMALLYNWGDIQGKALQAKMLDKAKQYSPYTTYVCLYIWRYKDAAKTKTS